MPPSRISTPIPRLEPNHQYTRTMFSLVGCDENHSAEDDFVRSDDGLFGRGIAEPLLNMPESARGESRMSLFWCD